MEDRKVIVFIAMSLDGYIAKLNGDISFLSLVEQPGQDYGYSDFYETIDTVIMGRKTYDKVISFGIPFPHADKKTYVITRSFGETLENIVFYNGDINALIAKLKIENGKNIFVDGGAEIVNLLLQENQIDELIISIIPILLGDGISLFKEARSEMKLKMRNTNHFDSGLVQIHYTCDI